MSSDWTFQHVSLNHLSAINYSQLVQLDWRSIYHCIERCLWCRMACDVKRGTVCGPTVIETARTAASSKNSGRYVLMNSP